MTRKFTLLLLIYLVQMAFATAKYKVVSIYSEQNFYLNGGAVATFSANGMSRYALPVTLPKNTVRWYYTISTSANKGESASIQLFAQLTKIVDPSGLTGDVVTALATPPSYSYINTYLFGNDTDKDSFLNKEDYKGGTFNYYEDGTRQHYTSGTVEIKNKSLVNGTYYVGIQNPSTREGISVTIEVAAIVYEESETQSEGQLYGSLAWKEYEQGNYDKCIELSKKAMTLDSTLGWVQCNIALCYLVKGSDSALDEYVKAISVIRKSKTPKATITAAYEDIDNALKANSALKNADMIKGLLNDEYKRY